MILRIKKKIYSSPKLSVVNKTFINISNGQKFELSFFVVKVEINLTKAKLLSDGAKQNRFQYLKIMYTAIRKILHLLIYW